jgi:hypothetical protein
MKLYYRFLVIVLILLGFSTIIPAPASRPSMLGYYAHCSFTPVSTVILWALACLIYWLGRRKGG